MLLVGLDEARVELLGEHADGHVLEIESLVIVRHVEDGGGQVGAEHVRVAVAERRIELVRILLVGDVPLGTLIAKRTHILPHLAEERVGDHALLALHKLQVLVEQLGVHDHVVVHLEHEASVLAVLRDPFHAHERLERQVLVRVDKVLLDDVVEQVDLVAHASAHVGVVGRAEQEDELHLRKDELVRPRVANGDALLEVGQTARYHDEELDVVAARRVTQLVARIVQVDKRVRVDDEASAVDGLMRRRVVGHVLLDHLDLEHHEHYAAQQEDAREADDGRVQSVDVAQPRCHFHADRCC